MMATEPAQRSMKAGSNETPVSATPMSIREASLHASMCMQDSSSSSMSDGNGGVNSIARFV